MSAVLLQAVRGVAYAQPPICLLRYGKLYNLRAVSRLVRVAEDSIGRQLLAKDQAKVLLEAMHFQILLACNLRSIHLAATFLDLVGQP